MLILSGLIGAIIGVVISTSLALWKFNRDDRGARVDELCSAIKEVAKESVNYWAQKYEKDQDRLATEARIVGHQALIDGLYSDLRIFLKKDDVQAVEDTLADAYDAFSGGTFTEKDREPDLLRAKIAPSTASLAVVQLRKAHRRSLPFARFAHAIHANRWRDLDMPTPISLRADTQH